jgi:eukaryotic-like serine/threonine-protein kinase
VQCPEPDALLDYLAGRLDARANARAREHIAQCAACHAIACDLVRSAAEGVCVTPGTKVQVASYELSRGATIGGKYVLDRELGQGAMGVVWSATTHTGERVAIKLLKGFDAAARKRFAREISIAGSLRHPALARVEEVLPDVEAGCPALVMELLEGQSLAARLREGALSVASARQLGADLAEALAYVHQAGVVHRDVKPANVFLLEGEPDSWKLLDLGLATVTDGGALGTMSRITRTGQTVGTLLYMAPEQLAGGEVDGRTDVWSLGVMLHECFVGRVPFSARSPADLLRRIVRGPVPDFDAVDPLASKVVRAMLTAAVEGRPSMRVVADRLAALADRPPT